MASTPTSKTCCMPTQDIEAVLNKLAMPSSSKASPAATGALAATEKVAHNPKESDQMELVEPCWPWRTSILGHCHCKGVEYIINPNQAVSKNEYERSNRRPYVVCYDHCKPCRRLTSSFPYVSWLIFPTKWLTYTKRETLKEYISSDDGNGKVVTRTFCGNCGTSLTYWNSRRKGRVDCIDITVASLAEEWIEKLPQVLNGEEAEGNVEVVGKYFEAHVWWEEGVDRAKEGLKRLWGDSAEGDKVLVYKTGALVETSRVKIGEEKEKQGRTEQV